MTTIYVVLDGTFLNTFNIRQHKCFCLYTHNTSCDFTPIHIMINVQVGTTALPLYRLLDRHMCKDRIRTQICVWGDAMMLEIQIQFISSRQNV